MNTAIYIRVSSEGQAIKGHSLEAQEKAAILICEQNKWIYEVFRESGKSASKDTLDNRPELKKILDLAEDQKIQFCFVTELDRLSRNPITLEFIKTVFRENNVKVVTLSGTYDFLDAENVFMADLLGLLAKRENSLRVKRTKRAILEGMLKGQWCIGRQLAPYGYKKEGKLLFADPEESEAYKQIVGWCLEGKGALTICRLLNEMGIKTRLTKGNKVFKWKQPTILRILKNPFYKGEFVFKNHKINVPAIIEADKWQLIQNQLSSNYKNSRRNTKRFYLLRGLLYCKRCGHRLFGKIKESSHERLYCCLSKRPEYDNCGLRSVNLDKIEKLIWDKTREIVLNPGRFKEYLDAQKEGDFIDAIELDVQVAQLESLIKAKDQEVRDVLRRKTSLKNITDEEIDNVISEIKSERDDLTIRLNELKDKIRNNIEAKEKLKQVSRSLDTVRKDIDSFTDEERYEFLHAIISKIEVDYDDKLRDHSIEIIYGFSTEANTYQIPPIEQLAHQRRCHNRGLRKSFNTNILCDVNFSMKERIK